MKSIPFIPDSQAPRLAVVGSSLSRAGAEKQTCYMARALYEAGLDTRFFYLGTGGHYESVLRATGMPFEKIYTRNKPLRILAGLVRGFGRFRPQITLMPQFGDLLQGGLASRVFGALTIGGVRSDGWYELNTSGRRGPWMFRLAHGLIGNSHTARQNLARAGLDADKIEILPNVVDLAEFDVQSQAESGLCLPANRVIALAAGRLVASKRFDRFLSALARARQQEPRLFGVIAGADGGMAATWQDEARRLGLTADHVLFTGECSTMPALLARADFLVLCSDYEGLPNVILEAMAAGRAVVTVRVGDAGLIVEHERTGLVLDESGPEALAEGMLRLAQSADLRASYGRAGRRRVEAAYSYQHLAKSIMAILDRFAIRRGRGFGWPSVRSDVGESGCSVPAPRPATATPAGGREAGVGLTQIPV